MKVSLSKSLSKDDEITRLKELVKLKDKEIAYFKKIASDTGNIRLRETEELSKINALLKSKIDIVLQQRLELEYLYEKIEKISVTDQLTGLLNRRGLMMQVDHVFHTYKRQVYHENSGNFPESGFTCVILDIDHFKIVNDNYGHLAGDKILIELGNIINSPGLFRTTDILGRYGGEEFMIILSGSNTDTAIQPIKRLCQKIRANKFILDSGAEINVTVSIGLSQTAPDDSEFDSIFRRADQALYIAKSSGRDRIEII